MALTPNEADDCMYEKNRPDQDARARRFSHTAKHIEDVIDRKIREKEFVEVDGHYEVTWKVLANSFHIIPASEGLELETLVAVKYQIWGWGGVKIAYQPDEDGTWINLIIKLYKEPKSQYVPQGVDLTPLFRFGPGRVAPAHDPDRQSNPIIEQMAQSLAKAIKDGKQDTKIFNGS